MFDTMNLRAAFLIGSLGLYGTLGLAGCAERQLETVADTTSHREAPVPAQQPPHGLAPVKEENGMAFTYPYTTNEIGYYANGPKSAEYRTPDKAAKMLEVDGGYLGFPPHMIPGKIEKVISRTDTLVRIQIKSARSPFHPIADLTPFTFEGKTVWLLRTLREGEQR